MAKNSSPFTFEISTPAGWIHVPTAELDQNSAEDWLDRIADLADVGIPPAFDSIARIMLERLNDDTSEFGSYFLDVFMDEPTGEPYVVFALLTLMPGNLEGEECPSIAELEAQVKSTYGDTLSSTREIRTEQGQECLSLSLISRKSYGIDSAKVEVEYLDLRIFIPLPQFDQIVSLLLVTPNVELEDEFRDLFEAVASTLRFEAAPMEELP